VWGLTEARVAAFGMSFGIGAFMLFMLFIVGDLAWRAKAGRTGTLVLFFVLSLGMVGFVAKSLLQTLWGI